MNTSFGVPGPVSSSHHQRDSQACTASNRRLLLHRIRIPRITTLLHPPSMGGKHGSSIAAAAAAAPLAGHCHKSAASRSQTEQMSWCCAVKRLNMSGSKVEKCLRWLQGRQAAAAATERGRSAGATVAYRCPGVHPQTVGCWAWL